MKTIGIFIAPAMAALSLFLVGNPCTAEAVPANPQETNPLAETQLMKEAGVPINDLYRLMNEQLDLARGDPFLWSPERSRIQAVSAAKVIQRDPNSEPSGAGAAMAPLILKSPNGELVLAFRIKGFGERQTPCYQVTFKGQPVIEESRLDLAITNAPWSERWRMAGQIHTTHNSTWRPVCGERSVIRDHYHQLVVDLEGTDAPRRRLRLTFRAYGEGVAFCYTIPRQPDLDQAAIAREHTEFCFPADWMTWATYQAQGLYSNVRLSGVRPGCERPLVVEAATKLYVALAEAKLVDYSRMKLVPLEGAAHSLVSQLDGPVTSPLPLQTPWRVVMAADSPGRLLENNGVILNLNDPCALADTSWIRPGKVIREITLTTRGGKACVDFAAQHHLQYVELDAGWYGSESDPGSDARGVHLDPRRSKGPLDLTEVIRYGKAHGIGVILCVNHLAAERQLDEILPLYHSWGIQGVKYGFVNVGAQAWTRWLHRAVRAAAESRLMVDVHDEYRPTGYQRTYPNWMTTEGIRGDEEKDRDNAQSLVAQFSRFLAGPADNTICYYDPRVDRLATHAYQLAKTVCFYSPWQFLFWYDRPGSIGNPAAPNVIGQEPELEFFDHVPTVWDDTKVLEGNIGQYCVIARRSGSEWFLGAMNADTPREFSLPLNFLDPGQKYLAHIYSDDPSVPTRTHVKIGQLTVNRGSVLRIALPARGGQAVWITLK